MLETLHITEAYGNFDEFSPTQRRRLIEILITKQYRQVYLGYFCGDLVEGLNNWADILVMEKTWELFDLHCLTSMMLETMSTISLDEHFENWNQQLFCLVEKFLPMAIDNDLVFFRLASLRQTFPEIGQKSSLLKRYFHRVSHHGSEVRQFILEITDSCVQVPTDRLTKSFDKVVKVLYGHFFELLTKRRDTSPAFLLELLDTVKHCTL